MNIRFIDEIPTQEQYKAKLMGMEANYNGQPIEDNPYELNADLCGWWLTGWQNADCDLKNSLY